MDVALGTGAEIGWALPRFILEHSRFIVKKLIIYARNWMCGGVQLLKSMNEA